MATRRRTAPGGTTWQRDESGIDLPSPAMALAVITLADAMRLVAPGIYAKWKAKFGPKAWDALERHTGPLGA